MNKRYRSLIAKTISSTMGHVVKSLVLRLETEKNVHKLNPQKIDF